MKKLKEHISGKDIRRMYSGFLISAVALLALGLYLFLVVVLNPTPEYEDLLEDSVTVEKIEYHNTLKGGGYYGLTTTDGNIYRLSGDYSITELREKLVSGSEISIKWYTLGALMFDKSYISEISFEGELLSVYRKNDMPIFWVALIGGVALLIIGVGFIISYLVTVKKEILKLPKKYRD